MKKFIRCLPCYGSGQVLGGGMIQKDCEECDGRGKIEETIDDMEYLKVRSTESYDNAINKIKSLHPSISDEKAKELFENELKEIDKQENKQKKNRRD